MDSETLATYRRLAGRGPGVVCTGDVLLELLAYVDEIEASRARLREVSLAGNFLKSATTQVVHDMAKRAFERRWGALQPGDLRDEEAPCDTPS